MSGPALGTDLQDSRTPTMASDPGSMPNSSSSKKTQGIGSAGVMDEADVHRNKDLSQSRLTVCQGMLLASGVGRMPL